MTAPVLCKKTTGWRFEHFLYGKLEKQAKCDDPWSALHWLLNSQPCPDIEKAQKAQQKTVEEEA